MHDRNRTRIGRGVRGADAGDALAGVAVGDDVAVSPGDGLGVGVGGGGDGMGVGVGVKLGRTGGGDDTGDAAGEAVGGGDDGGGSLRVAATAIAVAAAITVAAIIVARIIRRRRSPTEESLDQAVPPADAQGDLGGDPGHQKHRRDDHEVPPRLRYRRRDLLPRPARHRNDGTP